MELKKNPEFDSQKVRFPLMMLGFLIIGSLVLTAFSYQIPVENDQKTEKSKAKDDIPEEQIQEDTPPPPPVDNTPPPPDAPEPPIVPDAEEKDNEDKEIENKPPPPPPPKIKVEPKKAAAPIVDYPDVEAQFPGGAAAMKQYLAENIQYPEMAIEMGDQGKVFVEFVVNADGSLQNVKILKGVSNEIDREAKRVVKSMPKWTPAEQKGEAVRARCRIPISFIIR